MDYVDGFFEWQKLPDVIQVNRLPSRTCFIPYENAEEVTAQYSLESSRCLVLNGQWRFKLFENYTKRSLNFSQPSFNCGSWGLIEVPSNWQLQGYDYITYCSNGYLWEGKEDILPANAPMKSNPVGCYIKKFSLPENWNGQRITLCFEGVKNAFYVYINGERIGYSENGYVTNEFDITENLYYDRPNTIAVEVYSFSTGSWLNASEGFALNGIFRDVYLRMTHNTYIWDYTVNIEPDLENKDGEITVTADILGKIEDCEISMEVRKKSGKLVAADTKSVQADGKVLLKATIINAKLWSAENPYLYSVVLNLKSKGESVEYIAFFAGFRKAEIKNSVLTLNGKRLLLKGVNRNEFSFFKGDAVDEKTMLKEIKILKEHNINAVRTLNCPSHPLWYDLCDEYGIYVIDENNIDTHFFKNAPLNCMNCEPDNSEIWEKIYLDKALSLYERDKNHACVIMWSLGTSNSGGKNFEKMYSLIKSKDSIRPVCFSGDDNISDIYSYSFTCPWDIEALTSQNKSKPFILFNYANTNGNSFGSNEEYKRLWNSVKAFQGGFISLFSDRAVKDNDDSGAYLSYLDFNDNGGGLIFSDLTLSPKIKEVQKLYQSVDFEEIDAQYGKFRIYNHFVFTDLANFNLVWEQVKNGEVLRSGIERIHLAPGKSGVLDLELNKITSEETYLNIKLITRKDSRITTDGDTVADEQFVINKNEALNEFVSSDRNILLKDSCGTININNRDFEIKLSKRTGLLYSYKYKGRQLFKSPIRPNFYRTATENDYTNGSFINSALWRYAHINSKTNIKSVSINPEQTQAYIKTEISFLTEPESKATLDYTINSKGLKLDYSFTAAENLPEIPEISLLVELCEGLEKVRYCARGPFENYSDRRSNAYIGVYESDIDNMFVPYLKPQENGNRTDLKYAVFSNERGKLKLSACSPLEMNISRYSIDELENAQNIFSLPESKRTFLRVIAKQKGVGGFSAESQPLAKYRNSTNKTYSLSFFITPEV
ncbi:MAG: DUF4981 domain-containing protein [Clostridiales bacterium]|nr:DUF4981 domain-containing protein [Clostridiales bacterium]